MRHASLLEAACLVRLLPAARAAALLQANAAYNAREALPASHLCRRLWLTDSGEAVRCAAAHGVVVTASEAGAHSAATEEAAGVGEHRLQFHTGSVKADTLQAGVKMEPPLPPPNTRAIGRWQQREQAAAAAARLASTATTSPQAVAAAASEAACVAEASDGEPSVLLGLKKKKKRRPPPSSLLAETAEKSAEVQSFLTLTLSLP